MSDLGLSARAQAFSVRKLIGEVQEDTPRRTIISPRSSKSCRKSKFRAELVGRELWQEFHALGTEMIITKAGRRVFPSLKIRLSGLDKNTLYLIYVDIDPVDNKRYRYIYQSSKWVPGGAGDVPHQGRRFIHPDGPQLGSYWNSQSCVAFDKLKLTNNRQDQRWDLIPLHSMHRYQPKFYIQPITSETSSSILENDLNNVDAWKNLCHRSSASASFKFPETQFITVTAYQNQQITKLKIASNPFAKGFRDSRESNNGDDEFWCAPSQNKRIRPLSSLSKNGIVLLSSSTDPVITQQEQQQQQTMQQIELWRQHFLYLQQLMPSSSAR